MTHALPSGGAERQWCYLARGLQHAGVDVSFISTHAIEGGNAHYAPLLRDAGVKVIELPAVSAADILGHISISDLWCPSFAPASEQGDRIARLTVVLRSHMPDAVYTQLDEPNVIGAVAGLRAGVPTVVCSFRNYSPVRFSYLDDAVLLPAYRALAARPDVALTGNSTAGNLDYAEWIGADPASIIMIPNGTDFADVDAPPEGERLRHVTRSLLGIPDDAPVVIGAFRLSAEKRPELFLEACARARTALPSLCVLLAGEGPMEAHLRRLAARYGLGPEALHFLGVRRDLGSLMAASDLLLLTSRYEGTPNVVLEAQLAGIPVVAPAVGAVADIVADGVSGLVIDEPATAEGLSLAIEQVLSRRHEWAKRARSHADRVRSTYSLEEMVRLHITLAAGAQA